jgi:hypothetical protein
MIQIQSLIGFLPVGFSVPVDIFTYTNGLSLEVKHHLSDVMCQSWYHFTNEMRSLNPKQHEQHKLFHCSCSILAGDYFLLPLRSILQWQVIWLFLSTNYERKGEVFLVLNRMLYLVKNS